MNFLEETNEAITSSGHTWDDVVYIGSHPNQGEPYYSCTVEEFKQMADFEYHAGFGAQQIAVDLIILFSDGIYMVRGEYDGSEWWEYNKPIKRLPENSLKIKRLTRDMEGGLWDTLEELHKKGE